MTLRVAFALIARSPEQYPVAVDDIRRSPFRRFPFMIYYVVLSRGVSVIAVMHGRRHPQRWQSLS